MTAQPKRGGKAGMGVDAQGGPVIDPTENVIALVKADGKRSDNLRKAERRFFMAHLKHVDKIGQLRADHQAKLDTAESSRLDSIRQNDKQETAASNAQALTAIQTLAASNATRDEQVRTLVATTAQGLATTTAASAADFNKRLTNLEQSSFLEMGKQKVADPQLERLSSMVEKLTQSRSTDVGKSQGISLSWAVLLAAVMLIGGLLAIRDRTTTPPAPQVIYVPSPPGTLLPSTPPATVPR